jgi:hypothetical protein
MARFRQMSAFNVSFGVFLCVMQWHPLSSKALIALLAVAGYTYRPEAARECQLWGYAQQRKPAFLSGRRK